MSTLDEYFATSAGQMAARGRLLLGKIRRDLPPEYGGLVSKTRDRLDEVIGRFVGLTNHGARGIPPAVRQRQFRRLVGDLDLIENVALTALNRAVEDDHRLTALVVKMCREIRYPLQAPVVTTLSTNYFAIYPLFQLLLVPLTEGHFLLHLPDIYHELAHPLLTDRHDPLIEPFRRRFNRIVSEASCHFVAEVASINRGRAPRELSVLSATAEYSWAKTWATEFVCDLFAVSVLGPAFGWSHLHLHAKRGRSAFDVPVHGPTSHPADHARMTVVLSALHRLGFSSEANTIRARWEELIARSEPGPSPEYQHCYPTTLLQLCVDEVLNGTLEIGCEAASPSMAGTIRNKLNEAWRELWHSPSSYLDWEGEAVMELRGL